MEKATRDPVMRTYWRVITVLAGPGVIVWSWQNLSPAAAVIAALVWVGAMLHAFDYSPPNPDETPLRGVMRELTDDQLATLLGISRDDANLKDGAMRDATLRAAFQRLHPAVLSLLQAAAIKAKHIGPRKAAQEFAIEAAKTAEVVDRVDATLAAAYAVERLEGESDSDYIERVAAAVSRSADRQGD